MVTALSLESIRDNLEWVQERIIKAAQSVGRSADSVTLVVVTKGHSLERVRAVVEAGARRLGENYVEEALDKIASLQGGIGVEWHMIGHIQSRKAKPVCLYFDYVHSLDSLKLATRLNRFAEELGKRLPVLLECNVSGEQSKFGFPVWEESLWDAFFDQAAQIASLAHLDVRGLMTMAPYFEDSELARPYFRRLARLRDALSARAPQSRWSELSMGMSGDFETAIQEGATIVRIGQAILGARPA